MCITGYPRLTCYRKLPLWKKIFFWKLPLESLNSIPILHLWLADCLFLYLGFKVNDLGILVSINPIVNLKAPLKCLFFLLSSEETAAHLLHDSHSFQLTIQIAYYFLQPMSYNTTTLVMSNQTISLLRFCLFSVEVFPLVPVSGALLTTSVLVLLNSNQFLPR